MTPRGSSVAQHLLDALSQTTSIFGVGEQALLQDALGAQLVAAVDQGDLGGEVGQEQRLLDRGVAAADHHHLLAAIEEAVAGGAGRDAEALEGFCSEARPSHLAWAPVAMISVSARQLGAGIADQAERPLAKGRPRRRCR